MLVKYEPWSVKNDQMDAWGIVIKEGQYAETVIGFNDIDFSEEESGVNLDYTIYKLPENLDKDTLPNDAQFSECMKHILEDVLKRAIDEYENRKDNT